MATSVSQPGYYNLQALTSLGALGVGMRLYTYASGTTTHKNAYTEATGTTVQTYTSDGGGGQYIALDARGELPYPLYLTSGAYDLCLKTSAGATVWTRRAEPASAETAMFTQAGTGATVRTVQSKLRDSVSVTDFGAVGDGSTDDTAAIQAAIDQAAASSGVVEFVKSHTYKITGTLFKPYKVSLHGNHCQIIPAAGTYTQNFIILTNSTDGLDWTFAYPTNFSGTIRDFWINNQTNVVASVIGIGFADSSDIINVRVSYCAGSLYTVGSLFLDQKLIDNVYTTYHQGTNPMIKINGFGDMGVISRIICYIPNVSSGVIDCLQLNNAKGATIQSCAIPTYAAIKLTGCKGMAINALSLEGGQFNAESSDFVMNGAWVSRVGDTSTSPINLSSDSGAATNQNHATFNNVTFVRLLKRAITTLPEYDITYSSTWRILLNDVHRTITYNDSVRGAVTSTAPMLYSSTASAASAYNSYAHALPVAEIPPTLSGELNSFIGRVRTDTTVNWALTIGSASIPFSAATTTYYYKVIILLDTVRMIGTPDAAAELSRAITTSTGNDSGASITGGGSSYRASGFTHILRVYRGTSTGSYDKYVDIPTRAGLTALFDSGGDINGYPWKSRAAAGVDSTYLALTLDASNTQVTAYNLTAAPTVGTWKVGDRIVRTPVVGQPLGWRCTVAGTPGTWAAEANL